MSAGELAGYRNEAVVRFKNVGSGKYLNVHYGYDSNTTNVYQWTGDGSVEQTFRLRYNVEEDCYLIGAMCSSNGSGRVLDVAKIGGQVQAGCNVQLYDATDPVAQQWQFAYQENGQFTIFPIANQFTVLTASDDSNGSGNGRDPTSAGNVYLSEIPMTSYFTYSPYQLWEIEETEENPPPPIESGVYRITSSLNKYLTLDVDNNYNVCHVGDPGDVGGLDEMGESRLRSQQLWRLQYLNTGYYLITPEIDTSYKLAAVGDYEMIIANVVASPASSPNNTWNNRLQWKIVPNVGGGYRIVSKGASSTQVVTVAYGDTDDFTNVQMCPYEGVSGQRWTFDLIRDSEGRYQNTCSGKSVGNHAIQFTKYNGDYQYKCMMCGLVFQLPQMQDYSNKAMSDERLALIFALEQMASFELLRENREHFVQACLKATDVLRSECDIYTDSNGKTERMYQLQDKDGHYVSPTQYNYTASSMTASIDVVVETCDPDQETLTRIVWEAIGGFDFGLKLASLFVTEYLIPLGHSCTLSRFEKELKRAINNEGIQHIVKYGISKDLSKAITANSYVGLLNTVLNSQTSEESCISVMITVYDGDHRDTFQGWYAVEAGMIRKICIKDEYFQEHDQTPPTYTPNRISGDCSYDGPVFSLLFP